MSWMRSIGCAAILLLGGAEAHATLITVGLGGGFNYTTIRAAVAYADADTDPTHSYTISIAPGTYTNDTFTVSRSMTIQATTPGSVILNETVDLPNQKGIILSNGFNTQLTVNGLTFQGAHIADSLGGNGAGIRDQNSGPDASLTVLNSRFVNDQMGILQGNDAGEVITVSNSKFINNGNPNIATFGHAIYINTAERLTVDSSEFCGQLIGHDIKSRAAATTVRNSVLYEGALDPNIPTCRAGTASFSIDAPNGGIVLLSGDKLYQGSLSQNVRMVDYGEEGLIFTNNAFTVANTLFSSTKGSTIGIYDPHCVPVRLTGDTFIGVATPVSPAGCAVSDPASTQTFVAAADLAADPAAVPEPGSLLILGAALTILRLLKRPNGRGTAAS